MVDEGSGAEVSSLRKEVVSSAASWEALLQSSRGLIGGTGVRRHPRPDVSGSLDGSARHGVGIEWLPVGRVV